MAWRSLLLLVLCLQQGAAHAQCSRVFQVPIAPIGLSVTVTGESVGGLYPDLLRGMAGKDGCTIEFSIVPRARLEAMFEAGRADLLVPATRTSRRDEHGLFVPLIQSRALLISLGQTHASASSLADLRDRSELRLAVVRGFDYGEAYQGLLTELTRQGRLVSAVDALSVARMLERGIADATIMAPNILIGAISTDERLARMVEKLRYEPMLELPWGESGIYISNKAAVSDADRAVLRELLERSSRSGAVWRAFQRYYPPGSLKDSIRPRQ